MSAYAHQMEREFSAQSLTSRGNSEMGSRYVVETGFYMTSFAATTLIAGLVTVAVLFITLVVSLTVMLQSCQSRSQGVVEMQIASKDHDYCRILALHAELNSLEVGKFPLSCTDFAIRYNKEGKYLRDLNFTLRLAESYFSNLAPGEDSVDVVLMDIDGIFASDSQHSNLLTHRFDGWQSGCGDFSEDAKDQKHKLILELYLKLRSRGWSVILFSRKPERERNATTDLLISAGYSGWSSLIMRLDNEMQMYTQEYLFRRRVALQEQGFRIMGVISNRMDALSGPSLGKLIFKLPNPMYYNLVDCIARRKALQ